MASLSILAALIGLLAMLLAPKASCEEAITITALYRLESRPGGPYVEFNKSLMDFKFYSSGDANDSLSFQFYRLTEISRLTNSSTPGRVVEGPTAITNPKFFTGTVNGSPYLRVEVLLKDLIGKFDYMVCGNATETSSLSIMVAVPPGDISMPYGTFVLQATGPSMIINFSSGIWPFCEESKDLVVEWSFASSVGKFTQTMSINNDVAGFSRIPNVQLGNGQNFTIAMPTTAFESQQGTSPVQVSPGLGFDLMSQERPRISYSIARTSNPIYYSHLTSIGGTASGMRTPPSPSPPASPPASPSTSSPSPSTPSSPAPLLQTNVSGNSDSKVATTSITGGKNNTSITNAVATNMSPAAAWQLLIAMALAGVMGSIL